MKNPTAEEKRKRQEKAVANLGPQERATALLVVERAAMLISSCGWGMHAGLALSSPTRNPILYEDDLIRAHQDGARLLGFSLRGALLAAEGDLQETCPRAMTAIYRLLMLEIAPHERCPSLWAKRAECVDYWDKRPWRTAGMVGLALERCARCLNTVESRR